MVSWVTDVVTSWRHVMTSQNLNYLSQLRDVLESWFFFVSMDFWSKSSKMLLILPNFNCSMSWCLDVLLWRHKTWFIIYSISACRCPRKLILFLFPWFVGSISSIILLIIYLFEVVTSRRHVMTSQTLMYLSQPADVLEKWFFFVSMVFFGSLSLKMLLNFICSMLWRHDVISWRHKTWFTYLSL